MSDKLIAVDWGTTSFRAYLLGPGGRVLDSTSSANGILAAKDRFEATLKTAVAPWIAANGPLPVLMSGMIGSRQGWAEAPYVHCPAGLADVAPNLLPLAVAGLGPVAIVPGADTRSALGAPDVMRGEETQIFGALACLGLSEGMFVLPGTHAKWVQVTDGRIAGFATYMTGEIFAALKGHTILGRMMAEPADVSAIGNGFLRGVDAGMDDGGGAGALLHRVFSVRTLGLFDELAPTEAADYLSGMLIGAEIQDAAHGLSEVIVIGSEAMAARYTLALQHAGLDATAAPPDCAAAGLYAIARAKGLMGAAA